MAARVTVCIPTYNAEPEYLRLAISSALAQTYDACEVVVSENHSTNGSDAVPAEFRDPRLRVVRPPRHLGIAENFNFCAENASGEFLSFLGSDDMLRPEFCARLAPVLEQHPETVWVSCAFTEIDAEGRELKVVNEVADEFVVRSGAEEMRRYVFGPVHNFVASMMRTSEFRRAGGLNPAFGHIGDWELDLTMLSHGNAAHVPEALCFYRNWRSAARDERWLRTPKLIADVYEKHELAGTFASLPPEMIRRARRRWAVAMMWRLSDASFDPAARAAAMNEALRLDHSAGVRLRGKLISAGLEKLVLGWHDARMTAGRLRRSIF